MFSLAQCLLLISLALFNSKAAAVVSPVEDESSDLEETNRLITNDDDAFHKNEDSLLGLSLQSSTSDIEKRAKETKTPVIYEVAKSGVGWWPWNSAVAPVRRSFFIPRLGKRSRGEDREDASDQRTFAEERALRDLLAEYLNDAFDEYDSHSLYDDSQIDNNDSSEDEDTQLEQRAERAYSFVPRLGKKSYSFTPRLGKKAYSFSPRLGKRTYSFSPRLGKRTLSFSPRLGKRMYSFSPRLGKRSYSFSPRLGKKSYSFTPRLG